MERNYRFSDYYTLASTNDMFPKPEVCFGHIINKGRIDTIYLYIAKNKDYGFSRRLRHNFTLTFTELKKLIRLVKNIYPFKYKITSTRHDKEDYYKIKLTFENFNRASVLFVLTALRYSYEFPFNVICSDAFKLMQISNFQNRGFFNICNFIFRIFFNNSERTVHSLCDDHVSKTKKSELISRVRKLDRVHNLFNYDHFKDGGKHLNELPDFDQEKYSQDFWDNKFSERYNIYINNIKKFNKK